MKISKEVLKQIIKEELGKDTVSRTDASKDLKQRSRDMISQKGVDNKERGIIQKIEQNLAKLADLTDIKSGNVFAALKRLNAIIEKQIIELEGGEQQDEE
jgi:hypothetical protein